MGTRRNRPKRGGEIVDTRKRTRPTSLEKTASNASTDDLNERGDPRATLNKQDSQATVDLGHNDDDAETIPDLDPYDAETETDERITPRELNQGPPAAKRRKQGQPHTEPEEFYDDTFLARAEKAAVKLVRLSTLIRANRTTDKSVLFPIEQRDYESAIAFANTEAGRKLVQGIEPGMMIEPIADMFAMCVGRETLDCLKRNHGDLREFVERSTATTQCLNVIGDVSNNTDCWICGGKIVLDDDYLKPECEHVFPIAQAIMFTGLYETELFKSLEDKNPTDDTSAAAAKKKRAVAYREGLGIEYAWAHRICNQVKSNDHFITYQKAIDSFATEQGKITTFLNNIANAKGSNRLLTFLGNGNSAAGKTALMDRVGIIQNRCNVILKKIPKHISSEELAQCSAIYLQELVSTDPRCSNETASTQRNRSLAPATTTPTAVLSESEALAFDVVVPDERVRIFSEVTRKVSQIVSSPTDRILVRARLYKVQREYIVELEKELKTRIPLFQRKVYSYLNKKYETEKDKINKYNAILGNSAQAYALNIVSESKPLIVNALSIVFEKNPEYSKAIAGILTDQLMQSKYKNFEKRFDDAFGKEVATLRELFAQEQMIGPLPKYIQGGRRRKTKRRKTHRK